MENILRYINIDRILSVVLVLIFILLTGDNINTKSADIMHGIIILFVTFNAAIISIFRDISKDASKLLDIGDVRKERIKNFFRDAGYCSITFLMAVFFINKDSGLSWMMTFSFLLITFFAVVIEFSRNEKDYRDLYLSLAFNLFFAFIGLYVNSGFIFGEYEIKLSIKEILVHCIILLLMFILLSILLYKEFKVRGEEAIKNHLKDFYTNLFFISFFSILILPKPNLILSNAYMGVAILFFVLYMLMRHLKKESIGST